jgi:segregation and condensation protein B
MDEQPTTSLVEEELTAGAESTESRETAGAREIAAGAEVPVAAEPPEAVPEPAGEAQVATGEAPAAPAVDESQLKAVIEAIVYVAEEPATAAQIANALRSPEDLVKRLLGELTAEYSAAAHGVMIREVAGGYKMATKAEHHEAVRAFAKSLKPPLKLSLAALETLATIAYKQPVTAPEIMEIRGVQGAGVLKTLLDRKLIQAGGRKNVIGRPILYRTTKDFLVQFGLNDLAELPTLKEFEELRRLAIGEDEAPSEPATNPAAGAPEARTAGVEAEGAPSENGESGSAPAESVEVRPESAEEIPPENA